MTAIAIFSLENLSLRQGLSRYLDHPALESCSPLGVSSVTTDGSISYGIVFAAPLSPAQQGAVAACLPQWHCTAASMASRLTVALNPVGLVTWLGQINEGKRNSLGGASMGASMPDLSVPLTSPAGAEGWGGSLCRQLQLSLPAFLHYGHSCCYGQLVWGASQGDLALGDPGGGDPGYIISPLPKDREREPSPALGRLLVTLAQVMDTLSAHPTPPSYGRQGNRLGVAVYEFLRQWPRASLEGTGLASSRGSVYPGAASSLDRGQQDVVSDRLLTLWSLRASQVVLAQILRQGWGQVPLTTL